MICPRKFYKAHYVVTYSFVMQGVFMGVSDIVLGGFICTANLGYPGMPTGHTG